MIFNRDTGFAYARADYLNGSARPGLGQLICARISYDSHRTRLSLCLSGFSSPSLAFLWGRLLSVKPHIPTFFAKRYCERLNPAEEMWLVPISASA